MGDIDFPNLQTLSYLKQPWTHDEIQLPTVLSTNRHKHGDLFDNLIYFDCVQFFVQHP